MLKLKKGMVNIMNHPQNSTTIEELCGDYKQLTNIIAQMLERDATSVRLEVAAELRTKTVVILNKLKDCESNVQA